MTEPGRERGQQPLHILSVPVPGGHPVDGGGVAERVQARAAPHVVPAADFSGPEELAAGGLQGVAIHGGSVPVCEECGLPSIGYRTLRAPSGITSQQVGKPGADRHEPVLVELRVPHRQHRLLEIDIADGEPDGLASPKTGSVEEEQQHAQCVAVELDRMHGGGIDGGEQALQFLFRVNVRRRRLRLSRLVVRRWQRRTGRKAAADRKAVEPGKGAVSVCAGSGERTGSGEKAQDIALMDPVYSPFRRGTLCRIGSGFWRWW